MNQKLVHLYLEGLQKGYITYNDKTMQFTRNLFDNSVEKYAADVFDAEAEAFNGKLLNDTGTRKLPEFKEAVKLFESPLSEALK